MKKYLGDILVEKGYISRHDLSRALTYQMHKVVGKETRKSGAAGFLLDVARTKYNNRDEFYLGKILTELKLLPETKVREALAIQAALPDEKPAARLQALNQVMRRMNSSYNLIDLLNQILVVASTLVEAEAASLIVNDHVTDNLVILMPVGQDAESVRELVIPKDKGIAGWVYRNSRSVIVNELGKDPRFYAAIDAASGYISRQILCVPLSVKGRKLGAIEALNKLPVPGAEGSAGFSIEDQIVLEMFAAQAGVAIESTHLTLALSRAQEDLALQRGQMGSVQRTQAAAQVADSFLGEMRRSLIPLQGYAQRMQQAAKDDRVEKYRTYLDEEMDRLITHADNVVRFLRDAFVPARRTIDLREIIHELESRLWVSCRVAGIAFEAVADGDLVVNVDPELILTVLDNLFRNSRDAMTEGGIFSIHVVRLDDKTVGLDVTDTGTGITVDPPGLIFEAFFSSGKVHAAGLGLCIARKIVEVHGGTLDLGQKPVGSGALFIIRLPVT